MKPVPTPYSPEDLAKRKRRSVALALFLVAMVVLFFVTTLVRLGANVAERMI